MEVIGVERDALISPADRHGSLVTRSAGQTRAVGRALGAEAPAGTVLALVGPLGAGKTQLAKGVAEGLGVTSVVNSPTFILMNEHAGRLRLFHADAYRLDDPEQALAAGLFDDRHVDGVSVVEWADRLAGWLPADRIDLVLEPDGEPDRRRISWLARGAAHAKLAERVLVGR
jgi:tRNA threonylcarbamoyladenosine biosynthesis protein TsaE